MSTNKRVTDSYNEKVRARYFGLAMCSTSSSSSSSGSEHDGEYDVVSSSSSYSTSTSPCLSYLVQNFLEDDSNNPPSCNHSHHDNNDSDSDSGEFIKSDPTALIRDVINPTVYNNADHFRCQLLAQVTKAVEIFSIFRKSNKSIFHRNLMAYLREIGYNAGVCKAKWVSSGNLTAGSYEYLDVISPRDQTRYIIDVDFSGEFEIARETQSYKMLRVSLPRVFVCKPDDLKKMLRVMSDEARRSMKVNGLTLPPWRKNRFMQMKWLGPYRRSTNVAVATAVVMPVSGFPVKCRAVGFDVSGGDSGRILLPPVARTR